MDEKNVKPTLSWSQPARQDGPQKSTIVQNNSSSKPPVTNVSKQTVEKNNMPTYAGIFVAGLVIGVLVGWGVTASRTAPKVATNTNTTTATTSKTTNTKSPTNAAAGVALNNTPANTATTNSDELTIASPQSAGNSVTVSHVVVTQPTWVAVYDNNNGTPGLALGAHLFFPQSASGQTSGTITLLRPTVAGKTYLVGEYIDNGDHQYSTSKDKAVLDANGKQKVIVLQIN